jgi:hypothetical protein
MGADGERAKALAAAAEVDAQLLAVRDVLMQRTLEDNDEKSFRGPIRLYLQLMWLSAEIGTGAGDIAGGVDFAPTRAEVEVHELLKSRLRGAEQEYKRLTEQVVPGLNRTLAEQGIGAIALRRSGQ